jgi:hypothetical protein
MYDMSEFFLYMKKEWSDVQWWKPMVATYSQQSVGTMPWALA